MAKKPMAHESEAMEDMGEDEAGTQYPVEDVAKKEPPPEAESHSGMELYKLEQPANIKHEDYPAGAVVALTYEEYQAMRAVDVHCVRIQATPQSSPEPV